MGKNSVRLVSERLDELYALLVSGSHWTVSELANNLGVSLRTLTRDLDLLRARGLRIDADRGRGGGVRLYRNWGFGRLNLDYHEAVDLLLSLAVMESMPSPLLMKNLRSIKNKVALAFSDTHKPRIQSLRKRIIVSTPASTPVMASYRPVDAKDFSMIQTSFFEMGKIRIRYTSEKKETTNRVVEPQYLFLNWPVWYILAWDHLREAERFFRIDRIDSVSVLDEPFKIRKEKPFLDLIEQIGRPI